MRLISPGARFNTGDGIRMALALGADARRRLERHACRAGRCARQEFRAGRAGLSLRHRGRQKRPAFLRRGRRPGARDLGMVRARHAFQDAGLASPLPSSTAGCSQIADYERAIRSEVPPARADTLAALARLIGVDADNLAATVAAYNAACTGDPIQFDATRCDGLAAARTLQPPKSNWARHQREPPFPRLSAGRRRRLHIRRPCDRRPRPRAARRRADPRPLCRRRDHRAFLCDRAERGIGAARLRVRADRGTGSGSFCNCEENKQVRSE